MHNMKPHNLHFLQNITGVIKSETKGRGRWQVWATRQVIAWFWWRNLRERDHLNGTGTDGI
jgi:hypothetical protein